MVDSSDLGGVLNSHHPALVCTGTIDQYISGFASTLKLTFMSSGVARISGAKRLNSFSRNIRASSAVNLCEMTWVVILSYSIASDGTTDTAAYHRHRMLVNERWHMRSTYPKMDTEQVTEHCHVAWERVIVWLAAMHIIWPIKL